MTMRGLKIKENREKLGLTQKDFAKEIGVSENTVVNYERENTIPTKNRMAQIISFFNMNTDSNLLKEEDLEYKVKGKRSEISLITPEGFLNWRGKNNIQKKRYFASF